jgi:hypothetical protein
MGVLLRSGKLPVGTLLLVRGYPHYYALVMEHKRPAILHVFSLVTMKKVIIGPGELGSNIIGYTDYIDVVSFPGDIRQHELEKWE